jgi:hypothetical protein
MSKLNYNSVFVDWLTVSFSPVDAPSLELTSLFCSLGYEKSSDPSGKLINFFYIDRSRGHIKLSSTSTYIVLSCSGQAIRYLEKLDQFMNLLALLSQQPYRITRIDVSMDVPRDFPLIRRGLKRKSLNGKYPLSRTSQGFREYTSVRPDGQSSGTFYIGTSRHQSSARVYDKSLQSLQMFDIVIPTTTRYELTFRASFGISLKDAANPTPLFWTRGEALLLKRPLNVETWISGKGSFNWVYKRPERLPYDVLVSRLTHSSELETWLVLADSMGLNGRRTLLTELTRLVTPSTPMA